MRAPHALSLAWIAAAVAIASGCSSSAHAPRPAPEPGAPTASATGARIDDPAASSPAQTPSAGLTSLQSGAGDSAESVPGSPGALYKFRFRQTLPGSDRFTFQDRELSFYFKPAPDAIYFQVENRQNRPVWIDWERSTFLDPLGRSGKVAHAPTRYNNRFGAQAQTQIVGLQRYSDYLLPMDYLVDPAGRDEQLHRPLLPEDTSAPQFADHEFGVDLQFMVEDRPRTYSFRFKVASVIPR